MHLHCLDWEEILDGELLDEPEGMTAIAVVGKVQTVE